MDITTLNEKINRNNPLDFGDIFNRSFALFKESWVHGFVFLLLSVALIVPALMIIYIPVIGAITAADIGGYGMEEEFTFLFILPFVLLFILAIFFVNTLAFALMAGFFKVLRKVDSGEKAATNELFAYMKWMYLKKIFVISLMSVGIALLAAMMCYLPIFYVMVPLQFLPVIFAFNPELSPSEVIKAGFNLGTKKWLIGFGLIIVSSLLSQFVGMMLCGIGVLFTASFAYNPIYFMYKEVVGFDEVIDEIGVPVSKD